jgi:hypothetical protein
MVSIPLTNVTLTKGIGCNTPRAAAGVGAALVSEPAAATPGAATDLPISAVFCSFAEDPASGVWARAEEVALTFAETGLVGPSFVESSCAEFSFAGFCFPVFSLTMTAF